MLSGPPVNFEKKLVLEDFVQQKNLCQKIMP